MVVVERISIAKASPKTIWNKCFAPMTWETWDPDVEKLEEVTSNADGEKLYDGTKFTFCMKTGIKAPCTVEMKEHELLVFRGAFFMGTASFEGKILLSPEGKDSTKVTYSFGMEGIIGGLVGRLNKKAVVEGTEKGLENIVKLSEEASEK